MTAPIESNSPAECDLVSLEEGAAPASGVRYPRRTRVIATGSLSPSSSTSARASS